MLSAAEGLVGGSCVGWGSLEFTGSFLVGVWGFELLEELVEQGEVAGFSF